MTFVPRRALWCRPPWAGYYSFRPLLNEQPSGAGRAAKVVNAP
jgi:hypothetical protein